MFCPACGINIPRPTKFCRQCGARLNLPENTDVTPLENRFDEYLDGLFWTAFFGLGLILGGMVLIHEVLHFSQAWVIGYGIFSALVFLLIFGLSLWQTLMMAKAMNKAVTTANELPPVRNTNKMLPEANAVPVETSASVTEDTTRNFATVPAQPPAKERL